MNGFVIFAALGTSLLIPVAVIIVRHVVKQQRQDVIRDLERVFRPIGTSTSAGIVPSFEFVKFKYFLPNDAPGAQQGRDIPLWSFAVASFPLILLLTSLGLIAFGSLLRFAQQDWTPPDWIPTWPLMRVDPNGPVIWLTALIVAYLACLLYVLQSLLRAVDNFDLGPTSFLEAAVHVLFGTVTAVLVVSVVGPLVPNTMSTAQLGVLVAAAFAIGYVPGLGVRTLLRSTKLSQYKREDAKLMQAFMATPLEVIDGIDSNVRAKLSQHHIESVQNLATANPIMLFVETPYGVYEIIDWVAQAQLCTAVGPRAMIDFWSIGIRTIFDLERVVLEKGVSTPEIRRTVGAILVRNAIEPHQASLQLSPKDAYTPQSDAVVQGLVKMIVDDLHIQRLRQIWARISAHLGTESVYLAPLPDSDDLHFDQPNAHEPAAPETATAATTTTDTAEAHQAVGSRPGNKVARPFAFSAPD